MDLGEITLENVTVLGEIVISGGGVSEGGDDSIVLRNVNAPKLIVDNIPNPADFHPRGGRRGH